LGDVAVRKQAFQEYSPQAEFSLSFRGSDEEQTWFQNCPEEDIGTSEELCVFS
jgi:hypothetical protein